MRDKIDSVVVLKNIVSKASRVFNISVHVVTSMITKL